SYPHGSDCSGLTVILDAMASARSLIVSERQAHKEYIGDGVALQVPPGDARALGAAIEKLCSEPALGESMGMAGAKRVAQRFTSLHFASELARTFRSKGLMRPSLFTS
ncbi:MAG: glycosyltransferase, partial [Actinomycetota bacterium]